jgi:cytochrome c oxidase assembly factor CtaG
MNDTMPPLDGHAVLTSWQLPLAPTAGLIAAALLYLWAVHRIRRRHPARPWPVRSTAAFLTGLAVVYLAVGSFIGAYDDVLFSVHMAQHLMLIMIAPPLLVWGRPLTLMLHATRNPWHTRVKRLLRSRPVAVVTNPIVSLCGYAAVIVGTHLTGFMNLVLTNDTVHQLEHVLYLAVGYVFFLPLVGREPLRWRLAAPARALLLVLAMPVDTFTGVALLTYSREPFPAYADAHRTWGPGLVTDLHQGAAVMWIAGDGLMLLLILAVFLTWGLTDRDRDAVGRYLHRARLNTIADHTRDSHVAALAARGRTVTSADEDDLLSAYNRYLTRLHDQP